MIRILNDKCNRVGCYISDEYFDFSEFLKEEKQNINITIYPKKVEYEKTGRLIIFRGKQPDHFYLINLFNITTNYYLVFNDLVYSTLTSIYNIVKLEFLREDLKITLDKNKSILHFHNKNFTILTELLRNLTTHHLHYALTFYDNGSDITKLVEYYNFTSYNIESFFSFCLDHNILIEKDNPTQLIINEKKYKISNRLLSFSDLVNDLWKVLIGVKPKYLKQTN